MAATHSQVPDRTTDSGNSLSILVMDAEEQPTDIDTMKEQPLSVKNEASVSPNSSKDATIVDHPVDAAVQPGSFGLGGDHAAYSPSIYAPQPQAQPFYYRGYDNSMSEWDEYSSYVNAEGLEIGSPGVYNENPSLVFHTGYSYSPQMPYGPYSPVTTPLPSVGGDPQLYSPQQYQFSGPPYYQQLVPPNMPYMGSSTPVSHPELTNLVSAEQQGDSMLFGTRPNYPPPVGSFGGGNFSGNPGTLHFPDLQQGFDGMRSGGLWSDWSNKPADRQRPLPPISPAVSPQPIGPLGSFGQNVPLGSQQQRSLYGFGSGSNNYNRGYIRSGYNQGSTFGNTPVSSLGINNQSWLALDNSRRRGRSSVSSYCGCNGNLDILSEQNRGPRASKPKSQIAAEHNASIDSSALKKSTPKIHDESYNGPDFVTDYRDAKFFIIKSYSEDNLHKSIKYGVWASTPNGNKKLNVAYHEAKENQDSCPVFLFFSVNASAQFCGVAEMVGPVDFDKSVDYWQQDKWSGQFPVKWHIIKDVPNSQFRHIVLENNDHKPVTNSRDTQEVKLEQGIEMLVIFKNYETEMSILDDFDFYEDRQKTMQEVKARQTSLMSVGVVGENEHRNAVTLSTDFIKQMSKSFAEVVRVDDAAVAVAKENVVADGSHGTRMKLDDAISVNVTSAQAS